MSPHTSAPLRISFPAARFVLFPLALVTSRRRRCFVGGLLAAAALSTPSTGTCLAPPCTCTLGCRRGVVRAPVADVQPAELSTSRGASSTAMILAKRLHSVPEEALWCRERSVECVHALRRQYLSRPPWSLLLGLLCYLSPDGALSAAPPFGACQRV